MSWQAWTGWYVGFSCSMAQVAVHIFLQSTVLLGLGLVAGRLLRRRGAATQSVAYRTTLLAILLCPGVCCFFAAAGVEGVALPWPGSFDTGRPLGIGSSLPTARTAAPTAFATTQPRYEAGPDRGSLESSRRPIPVTVGHQPDAALSGSYASAEEVCDDYVVHFGGDRAQYARRLVNVAQRYQPLSAGVNVVSLKSLLGRRVARILDSSRRLSLLTGLRALLAIGMAGIAGTLLVGLLGMSGGSRAAEGEEPAMKQKTEERDSETAKQKTMLVEGCVVDAAGRAIAGAHVAVLAYREKWGDDNFWLLRPPEVAYQGATAADGRFQCRVPQTSSTVHYAATVVAIAPGYGMNWWELEMDEPAHSVQITLEPEQPLHGRLVGLEALRPATCRFASRVCTTLSRSRGACCTMRRPRWRFFRRAPSRTGLTADAGGRVTFPTLIPDAPYSLVTGEKMWEGKGEFRVRSGQNFQLPDIVMAKRE